MLKVSRLVSGDEPVAVSLPGCRLSQRNPAMFSPSPAVQSFGSGIRRKSCGLTQTGSIRVRYGSRTSPNKLNEFTNRGAPVAGFEASILPARFTEGVVEKALPLRRVTPPPGRGA